MNTLILRFVFLFAILTSMSACGVISKSKDSSSLVKGDNVVVVTPEHVKAFSINVISSGDEVLHMNSVCRLPVGSLARVLKIVQIPESRERHYIFILYWIDESRYNLGDCPTHIVFTMEKKLAIRTLRYKAHVPF